MGRVETMKAVILAGGFGTRLSEETVVRPKPLVEIGARPILWHIMKIYSAHGINDFVICCGYKGYLIKEYFSHYVMRTSDITIDMHEDKILYHRRNAEPWRVTLVDTGQDTMTGGRLQRIEQYLDRQTFCFTYGDGVSDIDITGLISFHRQHGKQATLTAVQPPGRFGAFSMTADTNTVTHFHEKPAGDGAWINGGFFVLEPAVFSRIDGDSSVWEREPLARLAQDGQLHAYRHAGFWQPMDTLRDKDYLERLWAAGNAPWKVW
jgi:glucose-1-phosphate cytidylyltransferase